MSGPAISALIVCGSPQDRPERTARSLLAQSLPPAEIVLLCDAASGDLPDRAHDALEGQARVLCAPGPLCGAHGRNLGIEITTGGILLAVEPGVTLAPDFLARAARAFDDPRVGLVGGVLHGEGEPPERARPVAAFLSRSRQPLDGPAAVARGRGLTVLAVPFDLGLYARSMLEDVADADGPFDESLDPRHATFELGWRAWRAGWVARVVPDAHATLARASARSNAGDPGERLASIASRHLTLLRHDKPTRLLLDAPWLLAGELRAHAGLVRHQPGLLWQMLREGTVARRRAREQRRLDASRRGRWGAWRHAVPPRGVWRSSPGDPDPAGPEERS